MASSRRYFLKQAGAITLGFTGLSSLFGIGWPRPPRESYGPLQPDPRGIFDLPEGFSYRIISRHGDWMGDGFRVPHRPDGMAAFPGPNGTTIIVRNHEIDPGAPASEGAFGAEGGRVERLDAAHFYDAGTDDLPALGGTTTLVYDTNRQRLEGQFLSLAGTLRNCAGGPTPWNTWITCEETTVRAGEFGLTKDHGYPFEVPATATPQLADPVPLKAMGRFNREAIAVDPASGVVYQTEDDNEGLFYRFLPDEPGELVKGGRLQALVVEGHPSLDTRNWEGQTVEVGQTLPVRWVDLDHVKAPNDNLRYRGFEQGAARFSRGEGIWYGNDAVYFACTEGGAIRKGQIWRYVPSPHEGTKREQDEPGRLTLFVEPEDRGLVDNADNLTVAPWGDLIVCEDGSGEQYLVGITPEGEIYKFGHNAVSDSELAGATFSPDGSTLFFNIQHSGLTLAVTGPWVS